MGAVPWLSRDELVEASYDAVRKLTLLKKKYGLLPGSFTNAIVDLIDGTRDLLADIDAVQALPPGSVKDAAPPPPPLKKRVLEYNRNQLKTVRSQQRPVDLGFTNQQWVDTPEALERVMQGAARQAVESGFTAPGFMRRMRRHHRSNARNQLDQGAEGCSLMN